MNTTIRPIAPACKHCRAEYPDPHHANCALLAKLYPPMYRRKPSPAEIFGGITVDLDPDLIEVNFDLEITEIDIHGVKA